MSCMRMSRCLIQCGGMEHRARRSFRAADVGASVNDEDAHRCPRGVFQLTNCRIHCAVGVVTRTGNLSCLLHALP